MKSSFKTSLTVLALAATLATFAGSMAGCAGTPALPRPPLPAASAGRDLRYLEIAFAQIRLYERGVARLDEERLGTAALTASALAAAGRPTRREAARWVTEGLDTCAGTWGKVGCERMLLGLQRVVLQYPEVLPAALLARLRTAASSILPAPGGEAVRDPWSFKETENQRAVRLARCLVALRVDPGEAETPRGRMRRRAAEGWGAAAAAFLRAHDRDGWYEAESPGYIATSMTALLLLADHAPQPAVQALARRQLDLLFADWAQRQVDGFPAGAKSRSYVHWSLGAVNTPWLAWAWHIAGLGDPRRIHFADWPEIATSGYAVPQPVARLLAGRRGQRPYEIVARRTITLPGRRRLDAALYSFATPDYILGTAQSLDGLTLGVSGGQEIMATLYPSGPEFAPLYLWSRTENLRVDRWKSWAGQDLTVGWRNLVLARLNVAGGVGGGGTRGYAYLSPPWERPERVGAETLVARSGDTYVALFSPGGWEVAAAPSRFPGYYGGDLAYRGAWAAVPRVQPAAVALEVGRRAEAGDFAAWKRRAASGRLTVVDGELRFAASDGTRFDFVPGERAAVDGRRLDVAGYPLLSGPFLASEEAGRWRFTFGGGQVRFAALQGAQHHESRNRVQLRP